MLNNKSYINGEWVNGLGKSFANINPSDTKDIISEYNECDSNQFNQAVEAAKKAQIEWASVGIEKKSNILKMHCENENRDFNSITRTLHTNVIIGENKKDLDNKINKISEDTTIPESYFHTRPLVGTKEQVFESLDKFKKLGCEYLIAYVADITWGNSVEILKERL